MRRRDLIKALALTAPLTMAGRLYAAPQTKARLLIIFLRGAYDAANVVIPISSDFYYESLTDPGYPPSGSKHSDFSALSKPRLGIAPGTAGVDLSALSKRPSRVRPLRRNG